MRAPPWARRLRSSRSRSARRLVGVGVAGLVAAGELVVEPAPDRGQLAAVRLAGVAHPGLLAHPRQRRLVGGDRRAAPRPRRRRRRRRPRRAPAPAPRRGRCAAPACARAPGRRQLAGVALGLPSWSPPIHVPKRSGGGAPGSAARQRAARPRPGVEQAGLEEPQALAHLVVDAGRIDRTSSVCHSIVASSASARSTSACWAGVERGSSSTSSSPASRSWLCRNVRRAASVGCAVSTGSSSTRPPAGALVLPDGRPHAREGRVERLADAARRPPPARAAAAGGGAARPG